MNLTAIRKPAVERRPVIRNVVQRSAAAVATPSHARALQNRVGNRAVQAVFAPSIQTAAIAARVSKPTDAAEMEAEAIARHVARMAQPTPAASVGPRHGRSRNLRYSAKRLFRRANPQQAWAGEADRRCRPGARLHGAALRRELPTCPRAHRADAAHQSAQVGANAFTYGNKVFFGKDKFQPQTAKGKELIAHELTHTIQQGAASQKTVVHRSAIVSASEAPMVQRDFLGIPNPRSISRTKRKTFPASPC